MKASGEFVIPIIFIWFWIIILYFFPLNLGYRPPLTIVGTQSRRWPGSATSNSTFDSDDLLDRELSTIQRFVALATQFKETGVKIIPALKLSRKEGQTWNKRPLDAARLKAASEVQRSLRMIASPSRVKQEDIEAFKAVGYKSVDETQVVSIIYPLPLPLVGIGLRWMSKNGED